MTYDGYGSPFCLTLSENYVITDCKIKTIEPTESLLFDFKESEVDQQIIIKTSVLKDIFNELDQTSDVFEIVVNCDDFEIITFGIYGSFQYTITKSSPFIVLFNSTKPCRHRYLITLIKSIHKTLLLSSDVSIKIDKDGHLCLQFKIVDSGNNCFIDFYVIFFTFNVNVFILNNFYFISKMWIILLGFLYNVGANNVCLGVVGKLSLTFLTKGENKTDSVDFVFNSIGLPCSNKLILCHKRNPCIEFEFDNNSNEIKLNRVNVKMDGRIVEEIDSWNIYDMALDKNFFFKPTQMGQMYSCQSEFTVPMNKIIKPNIYDNHIPDKFELILASINLSNFGLILINQNVNGIITETKCQKDQFPDGTDFSSDDSFMGYLRSFSPITLIAISSLISSILMSLILLIWYKLWQNHLCCCRTCRKSPYKTIPTD
ncbi:Rad1-like DNA damage checkpoint protein [Intoshia linei]|uniref:Rad1-like DNA damage checkpoint protein n=1 Tax=Intoshia linei TaxID=1819745 RepID=A0A177AUH3_9BILA|nr:Rad1-like DNA damage checkpoint protein [Intoshia linei]